jgi:hypothetical protein
VFQIREPFAQSRGGARWTNAVLDQFAPGRWALALDCDEHLVYPGCESVDLRRLCRYLDDSGADCMTALMVDMYPQRLDGAERYSAGDSLVAACPYFDSDNYVRHRRGGFPRDDVRGGARARLFYDEPMPLHAALYREIARSLERWRLEWLLPTLDVTRWEPPLLSKVPLVRWQRGRRFVASSHLMTPAGKPGDVTGALLHFKFLHDFADRVAVAVREGNYWRRSAEYRRYAERLAREASFELVYPGTRTYSSSADLFGCGLMRASPRYDAAIQRALPAAVPAVAN